MNYEFEEYWKPNSIICKDKSGRISFVHDTHLEHYKLKSVSNDFREGKISICDLKNEFDDLNFEFRKSMFGNHHPANIYMQAYEGNDKITFIHKDKYRMNYYGQDNGFVLDLKEHRRSYVDIYREAAEICSSDILYLVNDIQFNLYEQLKGSSAVFRYLCVNIPEGLDERLITDEAFCTVLDGILTDEKSFYFAVHSNDGYALIRPCFFSQGSKYECAILYESAFMPEEIIIYGKDYVADSLIKDTFLAEESLGISGFVMDLKIKSSKTVAKGDPNPFFTRQYLEENSLKPFAKAHVSPSEDER